MASRELASLKTVLPNPRRSGNRARSAKVHINVPQGYWRDKNKGGLHSVSGAAFGLQNKVLKSADQASFLTRVSGPQDEKSCTLTAREPSMYVRPTTEPLLRLVAAENVLPIWRHNRDANIAFLI